MELEVDDRKGKQWVIIRVDMMLEGRYRTDGSENCGRIPWISQEMRERLDGARGWSWTRAGESQHQVPLDRAENDKRGFPRLNGCSGLLRKRPSGKCLGAVQGMCGCGA